MKLSLKNFWVVIVFLFLSLALSAKESSPVYAATSRIMQSHQANEIATDPALNDFVITIKTDNPGSSSNVQFTIPTIGGGYNYLVDCDNDGIDETIDAATGNYTCTYTAPGTYTIRIKDNTGLGTGFSQIYFNDSGDKDKLLTVEQWGTGKWISMNSAFKGCSNLTTINATDKPDLSSVRDMQWMFAYARVFNADLSGWNTSQATDMTALFWGASAFNGNLSGWDTSQVTTMLGMFWNASAFNQDIGDWDTSSVTNMYEMFGVASAFNQDIGDWDTGKVYKMDNMFMGASSFDQDLSKWKVGALTSARSMFLGVKLSTANYDALLQGWDAQDLQNGVTFGGGESTYCAGAAARANMIDTYGWIITDGGLGGCIAPEITAQPQSIAVHVGDTANFTATARGYPDPTVQWQVSDDAGATWIEIPGATADTYTFTAGYEQNSYQFRAVFSNFSGSVTSDAAILIIDDLIVQVGGPYLGAVNTAIQFYSSGSFAPEGAIYTWSFGDGITSNNTMPTHSYSEAGIYDVCLTVNYGELASDTACTLAVVYDSSGGFATGGGWIDSPAGAYPADPNLSGKATFGFVAKYKKGADLPEGKTEFHFTVGDLNFQSTSYQWLVVAGNKAQFKGEGTINGEGCYKFMLSAVDGSPDTFRIKIWVEIDSSEVLVYDNGSQQPIGGGSIVVHKN